ncbi:hypothetical protein BGZ75_005729 [Mortierella antarctica]|nr:hypothetical protein BGZ67_006925 [Mortierella alpina]KAF9989590.1 hypothetical protein BGZ75_005729 [Mortierella antarctica]
MRDFPQGQEFFIGLRDTNLVLDVSGGNAEPGAAIILYTRKNGDNDNQRWIYENKQVRNKQTGHVLTFPNLGPHVVASQQPAENRDTQEFDYYDYTISARADEDLVVGINGAKADGAVVALIPRDNDSDLQQWEIIGA